MSKEFETVVDRKARELKETQDRIQHTGVAALKLLNKSAAIRQIAGARIRNGTIK